MPGGASPCGRRARRLQGRATTSRRATRAVGVHHLGEAPVEDVHLAELAEHDVARLEVAVEHAAGVGEVHREARRGERREQLVAGVRPRRFGVAAPQARQDLLHRLPAHALHREVRLVLRVAPQVVDRHDRRVLELPLHAHLAQEAPAQVGSRAVLGADDLEGHRPPDAQVLAEKDLAQPPVAELRPELVAGLERLALGQLGLGALDVPGDGGGPEEGDLPARRELVGDGRRLVGLRPRRRGGRDPGRAVGAGLRGHGRTSPQPAIRRAKKDTSSSCRVRASARPISMRRPANGPSKRTYDKRSASLSPRRSRWITFAEDSPCPLLKLPRARVFRREHADVLRSAYVYHVEREQRAHAGAPQLTVEPRLEVGAEAPRAGGEDGVQARESIDVVLDAVEQERVHGLAENEERVGELLLALLGLLGRG